MADGSQSQLPEDSSVAVALTPFAHDDVVEEGTDYARMTDNDFELMGKGLVLRVSRRVM